MGVKKSFTSLERDSKWRCRLQMTSLPMGRKSHPTNQSTKRAYTGEQCPRHLYMPPPHPPHRRAPLSRSGRELLVNPSANYS